MKKMINKAKEYVFPIILISGFLGLSYLNAVVEVDEKRANYECQELCFPIVHKVYDGECYCKPDRGTLVMKEVK